MDTLITLLKYGFVLALVVEGALVLGALVSLARAKARVDASAGEE